MAGLPYARGMTETITQVKFEDAIANTNVFLETERGTTIDGAFAGEQIAKRVLSVRERANTLLESTPHPTYEGLYVPISKHNIDQFDEAVAVLPGYLVLVPSVLVETGTSVFYPAAVSEDGLKTGTLRLHVLKQPYRQHIKYGASMILSAAGQSETTGVGDHGRPAGDGVEAEHFATLLAAGSDKKVQTAWQAGQHVNHLWRSQTSNSVTAQVSQRLFGKEIPQTTLTINRQQITSGQAMLLWHAGMREEATGQAETASQNNALVVIQGLGFEALKATNPAAIDTIKRMIA